MRNPVLQTGKSIQGSLLLDRHSIGQFPQSPIHQSDAGWNQTRGAAPGCGTSWRVRIRSQTAENRRDGEVCESVDLRPSDITDADLQKTEIQQMEHSNTQPRVLKFVGLARNGNVPHHMSIY